MNILLTTMGTTWAVVPELLAFTNPEQVPLLAEHPDAEGLRALREQWRVAPVDEVWVAATLGSRVRVASAELWKWAELNEDTPRIREFAMKGVAELASVEECVRMRELIFRLALRARTVSGGGGQTYLSLAGGRKTMSADMQLAAEHFGCDLLLHVVDDGRLPDRLARQPKAEAFAGPLPAGDAAHLSPLIIRGPGRAREIFDLPEAGITPDRFPIATASTNVCVDPSEALVNQVGTVMSQADHLMRNFTRQLVSRTDEANFHALYRLSPAVIEALRSETIGNDPGRAEADLAWLRALPKAELHCHLGGVLDAGGHLRVAEAMRAEMDARARADPAFRDWRGELRGCAALPVETVRAKICPDGGWKAVRDRFGAGVRHLATAAFLLEALGTEERVDRFLYGKWLEADRFRNIGFNAYESLGDLQGSSLLQSKAALAAVCREILAMCERENIVYCELRCSPMNCVLGGLAPEAVVRTLREQLRGSVRTEFRLIFIASRHGKRERIHETVQLAEKLRETEGSEDFGNWFGGFDLAGAESAHSPSEMREALLPVLRKCLNVTIHAGENADPRNIWEAVYDLNADRIGHGLTLPDHPELLERLRRRRVAIELCPSSNKQIGNYARVAAGGAGGRCYPLRTFLKAGLRVTVNTDDPGISRTGLANEYLQAANLSQDGLSRWEVLHLVRNAFKAAFVAPTTRKKLILEAESRILERVG